MSGVSGAPRKDDAVLICVDYLQTRGEWITTAVVPQPQCEGAQPTSARRGAAG